MRRLLLPARPGPFAMALLLVAAIGVLVVGLQHARLFHRGYAEVEIVGPLFLMNAIGAALVVLALIGRRVWVFVLGALSICVPSLISIAISHSSVGFLGFREGGYDVDSIVIVAAEIGTVVFASLGALAAVGSSTTGRGMTIGRLVPAVVVAAAMGCAIGGIGMGSALAERQGAPSAAAVVAARERIAAGGASVRRGRELFADQGCDRCHSIAAIDAAGKLGPRLDTLDEDLDDNLESIAEPRDEVADGYPERLMPTDFAERLGDTDLRALAAFVTAASGGEDEDREGEDREEESGGDERRRRGRGRGRSGRG